MPAIAPNPELKPDPDAKHDLAAIGPQKPEIIAPNLADLMICILATGLAMALIRLHMEEPTLKFRFRSGAPLSVSTRLFLGLGEILNDQFYQLVRSGKTVGPTIDDVVMVNKIIAANGTIKIT